jgi:hypothetical protein
MNVVYDGCDSIRWLKLRDLLNSQVLITIDKNDVVITQEALQGKKRGTSLFVDVLLLLVFWNLWGDVYYLIEYLNDAMRVNDDRRAQLKGSMVRWQDAALVLHNDEEEKKAANSAYSSNSADLQRMVAAMFSATIPIGVRASQGVVAAATNLSTSVLASMVQLPINVPYWVFYRPILPPFLRLSCKYTVQIYAIATCCAIFDT